MVQLIKINNEEDSGFFTNQFQEIINFEAESQMALVSSTFSIGLNNIEVTNTNNTFRYKRKNSEAWIDVTLAIGKYTQKAFIEEFRQQVNASAPLLYTTRIIDPITSDTVGFDVNPATDSNGKFTLSIGKTAKVNVSDVTSEMNNMTYGANVFTSNGADAGAFNYDKWVFTQLKFNNGSGQAFCTPSDNGFLGLMAEPPESGDTITIQDIPIGLAYTTGAYYSVIDGVSSLLAGGGVPFVKVYMRLESGKVKFYEGLVLLFETDYDYNTTGYYVVSGLQKTGKTISNLSYNPQSFTSTNTTEGYITHNNTSVEEIVQLDAVYATKFDMELNDELASLLGYLTTDLTVTAVSKTFTANTKFINSIIDESIEVHLINVGDVKSYDSVSKKSQRIIAVIPLGTVIEGNRLAYSAPELMYVNLNNKFPIPISSLTFRIVGAESGDEIIFESGVTMTLAVKSRKENYME